MTQVFKALTPYRKIIAAQAVSEGLPMQRPLFMHYPDDAGTYDIQYEYLLGRDLLVAPVYRPGKQTWSTYLPEDNWIHLWTGDRFTGGDTVEVSAPLGQIPVFYRADSEFAALFEKIGAEY
ncbi:TIM-barrel domain-containing protein [Secundilactobacillus paracollinoides]|nr:TIM-barrel domain-containing protein [Secundilactobacillus paracollinoides]